MDIGYGDKQEPADLALLAAAQTQITDVSNSVPARKTAYDNDAFAIGLVDSNRFSQECLRKAFESVNSKHPLHSFDFPQNLAAFKQTSLGLILYHAHATDVTQPDEMRTIAQIRDMNSTVPLVVLSDADGAQQPKIVRKLLQAGALGVVFTKTTGIAMTLAVIRFVQAGGTFVPPDLLLSSRLERPAPTPAKVNASRLTERQMTVLTHLDLGKANKLIAYELGMSESTVKVHIRNIMRKVNATNRTQAVYKARKLWEDQQTLTLSEA